MSRKLVLEWAFQVEGTISQLLSEISQEIDENLSDYDVYTEISHLTKSGRVNQYGCVMQGKALLRLFLSHTLKRVVIIDIVALTGEIYKLYPRDEARIERSKAKPELFSYLFKLLTDATYYEVIQWVNPDGTFKFLSANTIATLWGWQKGNNRMTYSNMCRALRYYNAAVTDKIIEKADGCYQYRYVVRVPVNEIRSRIEKEVKDMQRLKPSEEMHV